MSLPSTKLTLKIKVNGPPTDSSVGGVAGKP